MPSIPGTSAPLPDVYTQITTLSSGVSVPSSGRLAALLGEGSRVETLVASARGGGKDGLNPTYSGTNGQDGRHFQLSFVPLISNRTTLFKNGIPLVGLEDNIDSSSFPSQYDYRVEIDNGEIELQTAALVDQGGSFYMASPLNVGTGGISSLTLIDVNAPTESWTIRCTSVIRDGYGNPIDGYAKFIAQGSISGIVLDGYGNQIVWSSNGVLVNNGILSFKISEGLTALREGDKFTIKVKGGALLNGDSLVATYIAETDINDVEFFSDINALTAKHGSSSLTNRLSLGAQLAFANVPPGVFTCQTAPSIPRRVSYQLVDSATGKTTIDDLTFDLPINVTPDFGSKINFFITDPVTGIETQITPNKTPFYDPTITATPTSFVFGVGFTFSYTVVLENAVIKRGIDGVLTHTTATQATLSSVSVGFDLSDLSGTRTIKMFDAANSLNNVVANIVSVSNGVVTISHSGGFVTESNIHFEVIDSASASSQILFTDDLVLSLGQSLRATVVDVKDADFFDVNWTTAFEALEKIECDIVVPLPSQTITAIFSEGKQHVLTMSNIENKKERVLFIGAIQGLTPDNVIGTTDAAVEDIGILEGIQGDDASEILAGNTEDLANYGVQAAYGDTFRVVYFYPDQIVVQIGADRTLVDGFFIAAAAAGFLSGVTNIAIPLTRKTLSGFTILRDKIFRPITLQQIAASGITLLQPVSGGGIVLWGKTTTLSGFVEEQEISIIFIRDRVAKIMRAAFASFIGGADSSSLQGSLMSRATGVLNSLVNQGLITAYRGLSVVKDSVDPPQWDITVQVQPTYPTNFLFISISVGVLS
jgi:hypothetical protein